jgi:hypothetical protein
MPPHTTYLPLPYSVYRYHVLHMHALVLPPVHDVQSCPSGITYCAWHFHNGVHDVLTYFPQYVWHQVLLMVLTALHVIMAYGI